MNGNGTGVQWMAQVALTIPPMLLQQLAQEVSAAELANTRIMLQIEPLGSEQTKKLLANSPAEANTQISPAGEVYDLKLQLVGADGSQKSLSQFEQPITIRLKSWRM